MTLTTNPTRRRRRTAAALAALLVTASVGIAACSDGTSSDAVRRAPDPKPTTTTTVAPMAPTGDAAAIVFMREEEKLARDVYTVLGAEWGLAPFTNIAASEQQHMDAVATLIDRAGLVDPAASSAVGEFMDPHLQALYDELIARGLTSVDEALRVGVLIEETDIADLAARASDDATVQAVWDRLTAGSENHLRAFTATLDRRGA